jgi:2-keto-4-pentenoate hydratase/2-oxohepta-3-ene-1,7-dioic acid hydratase in catechol pathway
MRIVHFEKGGAPGIAANDGSGWHGLTERESGFPGTLPELIAQGADLLRRGKDLLPMHAIDLNAVRILPPVPKPPKILCVGLNYDDHLEESGLPFRMDLPPAEQSRGTLGRHSRFYTDLIFQCDFISFYQNTTYTCI